MRIATWNINGIKARLDTLTAWLTEARPDVVVLQEIKSTDETFPREAITDLGYNLETHGQKSFNGVAILSRSPLEDVVRGLPGDPADDQARWIEATVMGPNRACRVCGLYLPNGNPAPGPKYDYKLAWMDRLAARAADLIASEQIALLAGDFNVIPEPRDARTPAAWTTDALFLPQSRAAWRRITHLGLTDATREVSQAPDTYTFWDYQAGAWERGNGIRIDHILLTPEAADCLRASGIESDLRGRDRPSDHVPVWVDLDL